ncbi:MAG: T9SS type A sorting domain-containing protein [Bacteroidia bacterium]|nr:T9SS type A sorting domain-containing protein [Bacteroidia bacterium]
MHTYRQFTLSAALAYFVVVAAIYLLIPTPLPAQEAGGGGQPPEIMLGEMKEIARVRPQNHPGLGRWSAELGDINGDGYDDFAVSSYFDTTFVFLGGDTVGWLPLTFLLGGCAGLRAADVNGDGLIDIVTSECTDLHPGPLGRPPGRIRFYLNKGRDAYFSDPPDFVLEGNAVSSGYWGDNLHGKRQSIELIDFNGDDQIDLLYPFAHWETYLSGYALRTTLDPKIPAKGFAFYNYWMSPVFRPWWQHLVGDINGDGRTDVMIWNINDRNLRDTIRAWDIFLGRANVQYAPAEFKLRSDSSWYFDMYYPAIADINNDGCADIFSNQLSHEYGNLPFFRGRRELASIEPDDSLMNPNSSTYQHVVSVNPVGDINGDGTNDIMVGYTRNPYQKTTAFYCYPNRQGSLYRFSTGGFAVDTDWHHVDVTQVFPAGDVNGDGYDDVLVLARGWSLASKNGFIVFSGSPKLLGVSPPALPPGPELEVYPNPVHAGSGELHIRLTAQVAEQSTLEIHDITGRRVYSRQHTLVPGAQQITIQDVTLQPGYYTIVLTGSTRSAAGVVCH